MGVRGLTTFINGNSDLYFVDFNIHDSILIVDGNSLAAVLYSTNVGQYSAFGGDYNLFAAYIDSFITNLRKCKIDAIFIFDGSYEAKKYSTVRKRNAMKVCAIDKVRPDRPYRDFFPVMLRPVLQEKLIELGVTCLQSDFEADREIACIAKQLNAPVLSNDSDFFIFDVAYIPLSTFRFDVCYMISDTGDKTYYIPCQIFYVENFLKTFGNFKKEMLPLMASALGNDYLSRSFFKNFYGLIKKDKCKNMSMEQRKVGGLVKWLQQETFDSALSKILASLPIKRRETMKKNIQTIIQSYSNLSSCLESYIPLAVQSKASKNLCVDDVSLALHSLDSRDSIDDCDDILDVTEHSEHPVSKSHGKCDIEEESDDELSDSLEIDQSLPRTLPQWLLERSRRCQISPQILTLFNLKTYFSVPQMEDCTLPNAGDVGIPLLKIIAGIVLGSNATFNYWSRHGTYSYRSKKISTKNINDLDLLTLHELSMTERRNILLSALNMENEDFLNFFPEDWHLFILCLVYWGKSKNITSPHYIHGVIAMVIAVNIVEAKVGFYRKQKLFVRKFGNKLKLLENQMVSISPKIDAVCKKSVIDHVLQITFEECLLCFPNIMPYFTVENSFNEKPRLFSRNIIHNFAELQTILDLAQTLNALLLLPYKRIQISKFYCSTFLYNISTKLKNQSDLNAFLENFYKSPSLLHMHISFYNELCSILNITNINKTRTKKRKKRRKEENYYSASEDEHFEECIDSFFYDENNKFSALLKIT